MIIGHNDYFPADGPIHDEEVGSCEKEETSENFGGEIRS